MMDCSVIVPVFNGADAIAACAESLISQGTERSCEFLFVDNGSTDETVAILEGFAQRDARVKVLHEAHRGSYAARNCGIRNAQGEFLLFTDTDCVVEPGWVEAFYQVLSQPDVGAAQGMSRGDGHTVVSQVLQLYYQSMWKKLIKLGEVGRLDTRNCAIKRSTIARLGPFRADFLNLGDAEMGYRIRKSGYKVPLASHAIVTHTHIQNLEEYVAKSRRLGRNFRVQFSPYSDKEINEMLPAFAQGKSWRLSRHTPLWQKAVISPLFSAVLKWDQWRWQQENTSPAPDFANLERRLARISTCARILGYWHDN